jgi:hypothetical protein
LPSPLPTSSSNSPSSDFQLNAEPGQVLIAWGRHRGYSVIPKSVTPSRIESNFKQIKLSDEDYEGVSEFIVQHGGHHRFNIPINYKPVSGRSLHEKAGGQLLTTFYFSLSLLDFQVWSINVFMEDAELPAKHTVNIGA